MPADRYVTVRLREPAADEVRRLARRVAAEAGRDVTQCEPLAAAIGYALEHLPEVAALLPGLPRDTGD